jgi:hypothetical protein
MNSCVLITSHLNNQVKVNAALKLVDSLLNKNLPIIFTGNYPIPQEIQEKVDWVLYTKENPLVNRNIYGWNLLPNLGLGDNLYKYNMSPDYGYAHLLQAYRGFKLADSLGYEHVIHLNYDVEITPENWEKLTTQIQKSPNIIFSWKEEYATNIYTFLIKDFIQIADKNFTYYVNNNPPNIHRQDWFCESFFRWMVENSEISYHINKDIIINSYCSSGTMYWDYGTLDIAFFEEKNLWLLITSNIPPEIQSLEFEVEGQILKAELIKNQYFSLPHVEGKYYFNNKLVFNSTQLKSKQWIQKK